MVQNSVSFKRVTECIVLAASINTNKLFYLIQTFSEWGGAHSANNNQMAKFRLARGVLKIYATQNIQTESLIRLTCNIPRNSRNNEQRTTNNNQQDEKTAHYFFPVEI